MPFKEDRRTPTSAQWIATAVCGIVLCAGFLAGYRQRPAAPVVPPELRLPVRRPSVPKIRPARPEPMIRVNLTPVPLSQLHIGVRGPYVIRALDSERELSRGDSLEASILSADSLQLKLGGQSLGVTSLEIAPTKSHLVSVEKHAYHGVVRIVCQKSGKLTAVNVLPLEQYVSCVVDAEMPAKFPVAAREAQAIVARTYAMWQMQQAPSSATYDVFATVRSQKYLGAEYEDSKGRRLAGESASSRQAVTATRGRICRVQGRLFCTYYSAVCGGATTPGSHLFSDADSVLRSVPCDWCRESDKYRWQAKITPAELLAAVRKEPDGKKLSAIQSMRQFAGPDAGVISKWEIGDGQRTVTVSGVTLRQNLPAGKLLSPHCSMRMSAGTISVEGRGFGHGAGLCQWGARGLALSGKSATEIVQYYYPGATVTDGGY